MGWLSDNYGGDGRESKDLILYIISVALRKSCAKDKEYGSGVGYGIKGEITNCREWKYCYQ